MAAAADSVEVSGLVVQPVWVEVLELAQDLAAQRLADSLQLAEANSTAFLDCHPTQECTN